MFAWAECPIIRRVYCVDEASKNTDDSVPLVRLKVEVRILLKLLLA